MKKQINNLVFLIPSLDPDEKLVEYVENLIENGAKHILIIDDGSKEETRIHFKKLVKHDEVILLRHVVNQGKGRALKTGFNYVLENMPKIKGVVTGDADGQHSVEDTIACGRKMLETNDIVFGTRDFNHPNVPFKSRNGNKITTFVFKLMYDVTVKDTQTGLRALPRDFLEKCMALPGERYEYEMIMLIKAVGDERKIIEEPISTIYYGSNSGTHFNAIKDSYTIYKVMLAGFLRFALSSLATYVIDVLLYSFLINNVFYAISHTASIFFSTFIARVVSSLTNYNLNKATVFTSSNKDSIKRYYILAFCQMLASWLLVTLLYSLIGLSTTILKIIVDFTLFLVSYRIQKKWVFNKQ
ncbi:MAG: bifunctional glycosyltransferase family 2/GtrA family protein [Erysipelotrichaceae bacterium]|nr:bifunctional glycosyltransferase family 2/GtrA family protein [Erysipelotrichaceae bacterium]